MKVLDDSNKNKDKNNRETFHDYQILTFYSRVRNNIIYFKMWKAETTSKGKCTRANTSKAHVSIQRRRAACVDCCNHFLIAAQPTQHSNYDRPTWHSVSKLMFYTAMKN